MLRRDAHRYSLAAALCLVFCVTAAPCLIWASLAIAAPILRAIALLSGPLAFLVWVVTTVRSLHLLGLGYWSLASTYVILLSELVAGVLAVIAGSVHTPRAVSDLYETLLCAAAVSGLTGLTWSAWYNWRRTGSLLIAISVTMLQVITGGLIVLIFMLRSRPPETTRED